MESGKSAIDEKTAKIIEEMDKSLQNMEKSLGPDHPVVAKILDSYAKVLRQNNHRVLDAINMEARAKSIRAKNNQKDEAKQTAGLHKIKQQKSGMTMGQVRAIGWVISLSLLAGLGIAANDIMNKSSHIKMKPPVSTGTELALADLPLMDGDKQTAATTGSAETAPGGEGQPSGSGEQAAASTATGTATEATGTATDATAPTDGSQKQGEVQTTETRDPDTGELAMRTTTVNPNAAPKQLNMVQLAEEILKLKRMAKDQLAVGLAAEKQKDFNTATQAYVKVVKAAQGAPMEIGRPVYSEEIAQCMEGYSRMAELQSQANVAKTWKQAAVDVRAHLN